MENLKSKLEGVEERAEFVKKDIESLNENFEPEEGEEGTIKARIQEAQHLASKVEKKLQNAKNIAKE